MCYARLVALASALCLTGGFVLLADTARLLSSLREVESASGALGLLELGGWAAGLTVVGVSAMVCLPKVWRNSVRERSAPTRG